MADLLVHVGLAYPAVRALRDGRLRSLVYVGLCLPDLLYKGLLYGLGAPTWLCEPTHAPLGLLPFCYALALLFERDWRARAFGAFWGGSLAHVLVDAGKSYLGAGVILWGFPFTMDAWEAGLYAPEDTVLLMPAALALILLSELALGRRATSAPARPAASAARSR